MAENGDAAEVDRNENQYDLSVLAQKFRFFDVHQLSRLPRPTWLIPDVLPAYGFSVLYGQPGQGKSFLALDWALSIGSGTSWAGKAVKRQHVVYVAAEGILGYAPRVEAWLEANRECVSDMPSVQFLSHPIQLGAGGHRSDSGLTAFLDNLGNEKISPGLVVLDTLSRCLSGTDENSTSALSEMVRGVEEAASQLHAAFLLVHHTRKKDDEIRGSGVLPGAANMMASVKLFRNEKSVKLTCTKMKDSERFKPLEFDFVTRGPSAVLVFDPESTAEDAELDRSDERISENWRFVLETLPEDGAKKAVWHRLVTDRAAAEKFDISRKTIYHAIRRLTDLGLVTLDPSSKKYCRSLPTSAVSATDNGNSSVTREK